MELYSTSMAIFMLVLFLAICTPYFIDFGFAGAELGNGNDGSKPVVAIVGMYMDEIFHIPQAQRFCSLPVKDWINTWDPKITTFPGLYLFSFLLAHTHAWLHYAVRYLTYIIHHWADNYRIPFNAICTSKAYGQGIMELLSFLSSGLAGLVSDVFTKQTSLAASASVNADTVDRSDITIGQHIAQESNSNNNNIAFDSDPGQFTPPAYEPVSVDSHCSPSHLRAHIVMLALALCYTCIQCRKQVLLNRLQFLGKEGEGEGNGKGGTGDTRKGIRIRGYIGEDGVLTGVLCMLFPTVACYLCMYYTDTFASLMLVLTHFHAISALDPDSELETRHSSTNINTNTRIDSTSRTIQRTSRISQISQRIYSFLLTGICATLSILARQTNAVWVLFSLGARVLLLLEEDPTIATARVDVNSDSEKDDLALKLKNKHKYNHIGLGLAVYRDRMGVWFPPILGQKSSSSSSSSSPSSPSSAFGSLLEALRAHVWVILYDVRIWGLLLPVFAFIVFVIGVNGGSIVVGDKDNHAPVLHWAMALHGLGGVACVFLPELVAHWLSNTKKGSQSNSGDKVIHIRDNTDENMTTTNTKGSNSNSNSNSNTDTSTTSGNAYTGYFWHILGIMGCAYVMAHHSHAHPFLLADNRHYTFYLWRYLLQVSLSLSLGLVFTDLSFSLYCWCPVSCFMLSCALDSSGVLLS